MSPDSEPPDFSPPPVPSLESAVAADQVAAHAAEAHGHHGPVHTHCANCGTALQGPFCHRCGQHDFDFNRSFGHVFHEALENFFHFDTKLFRNIITLLFSPGRLTAAFNAGKRAAQMPPLRLYIFVSLIFFFVEFAGPKPESKVMQVDAHDQGALADALKETRDNLKENAQTEPEKKIAEKLDQVVAKAEGTDPKPDAKAEAAKPAKPKSALENTLQEKGEYVYRHQHEVAEAFLHAVPKMLLFCLPFFALYTRFLFRKSGQVYLQHLVVALHFHTFIFLWILARDGWSGAAALLSPGLGGFIEFGCNLWLTVYPVVMLRNLYGNSWKRTIFKTGVLAAAYTMTLGVAFLVTAVILLATL
jgi:hypothetical protein